MFPVKLLETLKVILKRQGETRTWIGKSLSCVLPLLIPGDEQVGGVEQSSLAFWISACVDSPDLLLYEATSVAFGFSIYHAIRFRINVYLRGIFLMELNNACETFTIAAGIYTCSLISGKWSVAVEG